MAATVYHIFNERRLELFIGATELNLGALIEKLLQDPPPPLKPWKPEERAHVREVQVFGTLKQARAYVEAQLDRPAAWRVLTDVS